MSVHEIALGIDSVIYTMQCMFCVADDKSRVCLTEIPGVEGSDYINASFIDVCKTYGIATA